MRELNIVYGDQSTLMSFDDGGGREAHYNFTIADAAELIANYGPDKVMGDLFKYHPMVYAALCAHFYKNEPAETPGQCLYS